MAGSVGVGFRCPVCSAQTAVADTRPNRLGIRRRRACLSCGHRFTTYETAHEQSTAADPALVALLGRRLDKALRDLRRTLEELEHLRTVALPEELLEVPPAEAGRPIASSAAASKAADTQPG